MATPRMEVDAAGGSADFQPGFNFEGSAGGGARVQGVVYAGNRFASFDDFAVQLWQRKLGGGVGTTRLQVRCPCAAWAVLGGGGGGPAAGGNY